MEDFNYEELRMIQAALFTEITRREDNPNTNVEKLQQYEDLYDKIFKLIQDVKQNG